MEGRLLSLIRRSTRRTSFPRRSLIVVTGRTVQLSMIARRSSMELIPAAAKASRSCRTWASLIGWFVRESVLSFGGLCKDVKSAVVHGASSSTSQASILPRRHASAPIGRGVRVRPSLRDSPWENASGSRWIPAGTALATEDTVVYVVLAKSKDLRHVSPSMPPRSSPVRPQISADVRIKLGAWPGRHWPGRTFPAPTINWTPRWRGMAAQWRPLQWLQKLHLSSTQMQEMTCSTL